MTADEADLAVVHAAWAGTKGRHWGDTHFAAALADAFGRHGVQARSVPYDDWDSATMSRAVVALRGLRRFIPPPGLRSVLWVISHPDAVSDEELADYDHVCVASSVTAEHFRARTDTPVHVLHQASDTTRFQPGGMRPTAAASGVIVVANHRWPSRRGPRWLRQLGVPFRLYGKNWDHTPEAPYVVSRQVPNAYVGGLYATADVVVADQWDQMARAGFVANRLFDVAAAGGFVLSDEGAGVTEVFGDLVPTYSSRAELAAQLDRWLPDPVGRARCSRQLLSLVREGHSFAHRAAVLSGLIAQ